MSEITIGLRNRFNTNLKESTEELLIERLDLFLSSIESRLDQFEKYFKFNNLNDLDNEEQKKQSSIDDDVVIEEDDSEDYLVNDDKQRKIRSGSASSVQSFKSFAKLDLIHQRLKLIKKSVLSSSILNLEYLYKTLDDQYNYLFSGESIRSPDQTTFDLSKEMLSQKIITTLQYFDEKLIHIDDMIQKRMNVDETDDSIFNIFKFYNFNKALNTAKHSYLHYYQLPLGWRENRYIINGYRFSFNHFYTFKSIFHFNHNEAMNIWTHLVGFLIMCYLWLVHYPSTDVYAMNSSKDNSVVYFFLFSAMCCLVSSTVWHTYSSFAELNTRYLFSCVDYTGITILITSSIIAVEYVSLFNYPKLLNFFVSFSCICGTSGLAFNWSPYFDRPDCRSIRIGYFVSLAGLGVATMIMFCFFEGFFKTIQLFSPLFYKSFLWYWIGVIFYGGLIPERWRYDVIINEDAHCKHHHDSSDIINGNLEKSGEEECEQIEEELTTQILTKDSRSSSSSDLSESIKFKEIIDKHFPEQPTKTNYCNDFFSLWWVDYVFSSHNLWHIFVVLGVLGHYFCVLDMFRITNV